MGLLSGLQSFGRGVGNFIDNQAYNNIEPGLLQDITSQYNDPSYGLLSRQNAAYQQNYPAGGRPTPPPNPNAGAPLPGMVGVNQGAVSAPAPSTDEETLPPLSPNAPVGPTPQMPTTGPASLTDQQRKFNRLRFLQNISAGLGATGSFGGIAAGMDNYNKDIAKNLADQQAAKQRDLMQQFQADMAAAAGDPVRTKMVMNKWSGVIGPEAMVKYAQAYKDLNPKDDSKEAYGQPFSYRDPITGEVKQGVMNKGGQVIPTGGLPPIKGLSAVGDLAYDPDSGLSGQKQFLVNGKPQWLRQNLREGTFIAPDGSQVNPSTVDPIVKTKDVKPPNFSQERAYMVAAGGDPDDQKTWTPDVIAKFNALKREPPDFAAREDRQQARVDARADRSFVNSNRQLDAMGKPINDLSSRLSRLDDTLAAGSPQADATAAGQIIQIMEGGTGSGIRISKDLLDKTMGGVGKWEKLKSDFNTWNMDPKKANSILPEQRQQIRDMTALIRNKVNQKQAALNNAYDTVTNSDDVNVHRGAVNDARKSFQNIDNIGGGTGPAQGTGIQIPNAPPRPPNVPSDAYWDGRVWRK